MNKEGRFRYNELSCAIAYLNKKFYLQIFKNEDYQKVEKVVGLFPVHKFSKSQEETAFHVANLLVLPNIESADFNF